MNLTLTRLGADADADDRALRPLLVLGSSLGTSSAMLWSPAVALLGDAYDAVAFDLPGHGASAPADGPFTVADLAAGVLAALDADPSTRGRTFTAAGISLGGEIALQLLLDAPERVESAALLFSGPRIGEPSGWHERAALVRRDGTEAVVEGSRQRWFAPGFPDRAPEVVDPLLDALRAVDDESYARCCEALAGFDVRDRIGEVTRPVTVVAGADDPVCTPAAATRIGAAAPLVFPGTGHLGVESPDRVARVLLDLLPGRRSTYDAGLAVRRAVLGTAHVDRSLGGADTTTADFQAFITRYAWGEIWTRPGLDRRTRSLITITALVAGEHWEELALHTRAAVLGNGVPREEIVETLLQTAIYCSVPSANTAFRVVREVFDELDQGES